MDRTKIIGGLILLLFLANCGREQPGIKVGSKNFTEQLVLGEIVAQHIASKVKAPVQRVLGLGGTLLANQALLTKEIDLYPEYTGTGFTNVLKHQPMSDPNVILERLRAEYGDMKLEWLPPLGFDNSFAMTIRGEDARSRHLETLSDAGKDPAGFSLGAGYEFLDRPDGFGLLNSAYGINWTTGPKSMDLGLLYQALMHKQVSMAAGAMTDGQLSVLDVKVLTDDKRMFPPYQACLVVRTDIMAAIPGLRQALTDLSGKISTAAMRQMNYEVDGKKRNPAEVAKEFLSQNGL